MTDHDPAAPHFAPLLVLLETVVAQRDYSNPAIRAELERAVRAARAGGAPPESVLAYLRRRLHAAPLAAVGDWYRGVLVDRLIRWAIEAYFELDNDPRGGPA